MCLWNNLGPLGRLLMVFSIKSMIMLKKMTRKKKLIKLSHSKVTCLLDRLSILPLNHKKLKNYHHKAKLNKLLCKKNVSKNKEGSNRSRDRGNNNKKWSSLSSNLSLRVNPYEHNHKLR